MHCRPGNGSMYSTFTRSPRLLWTCLQSNANTVSSNRVQSTANELLPPDNLGHFFNGAKEVIKIRVRNGNLRVKAVSAKGPECQVAFFETALIYSGTDYTSFIRKEIIMQNTHLEKTGTRWHKHIVNTVLPLILK